MVGDGADHGAGQLHGAGLAGANLVLLDKVPVPALNVELETKKVIISFLHLSLAYPFFKAFSDKKNFSRVFLIIQLTVSFVIMGRLLSHPHTKN